ncbi:hypothetical protein EVAR_25635_1 [Eumeta japonica]|uniref:Uncharacterized protein n=1 Tax=Eumeta variegata TaxID=151549 RepID=A0A4C1V1H6_EUMVA|nr:hypothetical protein EVAR_25635_1 [Eumeta japonica]
MTCNREANERANYQRWLPPMSARNFRGFISAFQAFWVGIGYLIEGGRRTVTSHVYSLRMWYLTGQAG